MKKYNFVIGMACLMLVVVFFLYNRYEKLSVNPLQQYCTVFKDIENANNNVFHYTDESGEFSLDYTKEATICIQNPIQGERGRIIYLWKERMSFLDILFKKSPLILIINIDNEDISQLSEPFTQESSVVSLDGVDVFVKKVQIPACVKSTCPLMTLFQFKHNQHAYFVEVRDQKFSFLENFHWER